MKTNYIRYSITILFVGISSVLFSQNVGINTTGASPSANAILDLNTGNNYHMGFIVPHVTLGASLSTFSPPIANASTVKDTGMMVYNMGGTQSVGYYYWSGSTWVSVLGKNGVANGGTGSTSFTPNGLVFEGVTSTSPLLSSASMTWNTNHNTLVLGTGTLQSQSGINMFGNINSYYQLLLQNTNSGSTASTDLIVNDDQDSTHYGDLGINSSTYSQAGYQIQSPGDVYFYSNKSNVDIGTVNAAGNGVDSIKFTCGGLNKSNLTEVLSPAGITTQVHFSPDSIALPIHTGAYTPKYVGEKWIYEHAGDTTECTCINTGAGRKVDSVTLGSSITWASTVNGFTSNATQPCKYTLNHKTCNIDVTLTGNSNSHVLTFTLPFITKNSNIQVIAQYTDNSTVGYFGMVSYTAGNNLASCANNFLGAINYSGWTTGGTPTKGITGLRISYEVQ